MTSRIVRTTLVVFAAIVLFMGLGFAALDVHYAEVEARELARAFSPVGVRAVRDRAHLGLRLVDVSRLGPPYAVHALGTRTYHDGSTYVVTQPLEGHTHVLVARTTLAWVPGPFAALVWTSLAGLVAALTGTLVGMPIVRRIRALESATRAIADGALGVRAKMDGHDEIAELARHFDRMVDRVAWHARAQETMLHAIAHEYRTPLATARFALSLAEDSLGDGDRAAQHARLRQALDDLERLADEVETYTRSTGDVHAAFDVARLGDVVRAVAERIESRIPVALDIDDDARIRCDTRLVARLVRNLLDNALRHARGRVRVVVARDDANVFLAVEDDGPGIPPFDRVRAFEPFVRLTTEVSEDRRGRGLGLAIVARIAALHGGYVEAEASAWQGARVVVRIPRDDP